MQNCLILPVKENFQTMASGYCYPGIICQVSVVKGVQVTISYNIILGGKRIIF